MSPVIIIIGCILIAVIVTVSVILIKSAVAPKKVGNIKKLIKDGKISQAEKLAKSILAKNSRDYVAHYWLGKTYLADKKPEQAYIEFKAVNDNAVFNGEIPETEFRKEIAPLYMKFGETKSALREYLLLTKLDSQNADNFYTVGQLYEGQGEQNLAMGFYQKAISVNRKHSKAHSALGYLLLKNKQFPDAKEEIDMAIRLSPETYSNYYYLGKLLKESADYSGALKAFEKAERDPDFRQKALIERGSCFMMVDQYDNAAIEYQSAIKYGKDPSSQETLYAHYFLAACYEKDHKIEKALVEWELIHAKNPRFQDVSAKLNDYRDLQNNDSMKEYLTANPGNFLEICKKVASMAYKLDSQQEEITPYGCSFTAVENRKDSWMNVRKQIFLVEFYRKGDPVDDAAIRKVADLLRDENYFKAIIFSSSGFTNAAIGYADGRPILLVDKTQLELLLSKVGV